TIDDLTATPGAVVPQLRSGLALLNNVARGTERSLLDITVGAGFPSSGLLIGVILGSSGDMMSSVRLTQTAGTGTATATATVTPVAPNLAFEFFKLTGATAGDTYTLYLTKSPSNPNTNPNVNYAGLTFDTIDVAGTPLP